MLHVAIKLLFADKLKLMSIYAERFVPEVGKPGEACGLVGVYSNDHDGVENVFVGMQALQHRGQSGAGLLIFCEDGMAYGAKGGGLVGDVITENVYRSLEHNEYGPATIGHDRYATSGVDNGDAGRLAQPIVAPSKEFGLGHNGHIENITRIAECFRCDVDEAKTDSEALTMLIDHVRSNNKGNIIKALKKVMPHIDGAASLVISDKDQLIAVRDRYGFRPLSIGRINGQKNKYMIASETIAFDMAGATFMRDIEPGEIIAINKEGMHSSFITEETEDNLCSFEYIYFAHPNSNIRGKNVYKVREKLGELLGERHPTDADIVVGVQNSGAPYARGYAHKTGVYEELALTKNTYVNRTFIKDRHLTREQSVLLKHQPNRDLVEGKRIVLVDDSIVRGTTMKTIVSLLKDMGASEVHVRIPSPPYVWPCFYGMDTRDTSMLLAHDKTKEEMADYLSVDSLEFLGVDDVVSVLDGQNGASKHQAKGIGSLCMACMTGDYPTDVPVDLLAKKKHV